jgi:hypothetical protein
MKMKTEKQSSGVWQKGGWVQIQANSDSKLRLMGET